MASIKDSTLEPLKPNGIALTENTTNIPLPKTSNASNVVPSDFLLPDGYPDVSKLPSLTLSNSVLTYSQYIRLILTSRVYEAVEETPLTYAVNLSNRLECKVFIKREDLQPVFSFKLRGAYNKMAHLSTEARWKGVVACSAGE